MNVELVASFSRRRWRSHRRGVLGFGNRAAKRLALLRDLVPQLQVVGLLVDPRIQSYASQRRDAQQAARALGLKLSVLPAASEREIDAASPPWLGSARPPSWSAPARTSRGAAAIRSSPRRRARRSRRSYPLREQVAAGGLMSFGPELSDTYRRIGVYAGKILKGATAADLPAEQSSRFELVLNRTTARALGLQVPARSLRCCRPVRRMTGL